MNDIRHLLRIARRRLELTRYLRFLHVTLIAAAAIALMLMLADRIPQAKWMPWTWGAPTLAMIAGLIALGLWFRGRPSDLRVAVAVDERLDLREKLSTALQLQNRDDAFAQAAIEDGVAAARDPRNREAIRRRFPVQPPKSWWISPLIAVVALLASLLSQGWIDREVVKQDVELATVRKQVTGEVQTVIEQIQQNPVLKDELADVVDDLKGSGLNPDVGRDPESLKREAIKKVTDLNKRLDNLVNGEKGKTEETLAKGLKQLQTPEDGPAKEFSKAVANGDFQEAKKQLEDIAKNVQEGALDEEQMKNLAEQLEKMAEQLNQIAQQQNQLQEALKQAGLDPNLANNPQALQQALQQAQNLNQQQKRQLQQMAQAQQQANQMMQQLAQACEGMSQAAQQGAGQQQQQQMGQAAQQAAQQLNDMEQLQQLMQQAQAAANACQSACQGMGQGQGQGQGNGQQDGDWQNAPGLQPVPGQGQGQAMGQNQNQGQGGGMGQRGQGAGGKAPIAPTPWGSKTQKADIKSQEGEIIARTLINAPQNVGQSTKVVREAVLHDLGGYDDAQMEEELPRKYHEAQKHFFGELEKRVRAAGGTEPTAEATAQPAESGANAEDD